MTIGSNDKAGSKGLSGPQVFLPQDVSEISHVFSHGTMEKDRCKRKTHGSVVGTVFVGNS